MHDLEFVAQVDPECTTQGVAEHYECRNKTACGMWFYDANGEQQVVDKTQLRLPARGHSKERRTEITEVSAGCEEAGGYTETSYCTRCGAVLSVDHVTDEPSGHEWDGGKVTRQATLKKEGQRTFTCTVCQETRTETIPQPAPKKMTASGKKALVITWNKVADAEGYDVYFGRYGKALKKIKTIKGNKKFKFKKTSLKAGKVYCSYVRAWVKQDGAKKYVAASPKLCAYAGNGNKKYTNARSIKAKVKTVSLKAGKTYKIKAKVIKTSGRKKLMPKKYAGKLRYLSTDKNVATVTASGRIKARTSGSCSVYVFAHNGACRKIKVIVK